MSSHSLCQKGYFAVSPPGVILGMRNVKGNVSTLHSSNMPQFHLTFPTPTPIENAASLTEREERKRKETKAKWARWRTHFPKKLDYPPSLRNVVRRSTRPALDFHLSRRRVAFPMIPVSIWPRQATQNKNKKEKGKGKEEKENRNRILQD